MAVNTIPFDIKNETDNDRQLKEDLLRELPEAMIKATNAHPHLLAYLNSLPVSEMGVPQYVSSLSRKSGESQRPNLIYPVHRSGVFIHILTGEERNHYIPIEPSFGLDLDSLMQDIEVQLLNLKSRLKRINPDEDKERQYLDYLSLVTDTLDAPVTKTEKKGLGFLNKYTAGISKIKLTKRQFDGVKYLFIRNKIGLGAIDPFIVDPYIEDISCSGLGRVFIEHKIFKSLVSTVDFQVYEDLDEFVLWLGERVKKPVTFKNPISDATLPDGSRINIVYGRDVSRRGSNFSIRKFSEVPLSVFEILESGSISYQMLAYLSLAIGNGMNVFVSGETASGKTTLLNAVTAFIPPLAKIITIEDTPELQVPHQNWIREVVQSNKVEDSSGAITMFDLLKAALRQRPDEIMVGEIRGKEGNVAFQAMQTGHSVMATFHAASIEKLIQRVTGDPILVPKNYVDNLNVVIFTSQVKLPNGKTGRRITNISEIVSYDSSTESFSFVDSFKWNQETDVFEFTGYMTSFVLEEKIAPRLGIPQQKKQRIYAEMERRAIILSKLHKDRGVNGFYEVLDVLNRAQQEGLF
ncbi:MAG: type II/IV secretion system ATPase subunit [Dehalococcoidales bacterium]|nr:type II/IV secretion system ATPase subunit [Dehalococcoidales bacterium]